MKGFAKKNRFLCFKKQDFSLERRLDCSKTFERGPNSNGKFFDFLYLPNGKFTIFKENHDFWAFS